ncbi:hypothetical protein H8K52_04965 [Undibacterium seohonense]|jgi:hypothetical protein|uniref:HEPN domain-containing protein n=1 Tax=Undibacterium seohonense TaxID=1344950 RepID=A0ABR6X1P4_9BURK|nr:hypothetical protein [Undibacterium seohonense]MBC3806696.1 hypothetical protein [Undibacterium seohonense]
MQLASEIITRSHLLEPNCFSFFDQNDVGLKIVITSSTTFILTLDTERFARLGSVDPLFDTHVSASSFLVALCIASIGLFTWKNGPTFHPMYTVTGKGGIKLSEEVVLSQESDGPTYEELRPLTEQDVERCLLVYGALMREKQQVWRMEYLKGLLHCTAAHMDIDFYRDAFMNFYRCSEFFATRRVLGLKRLTNEVKQIRQALVAVGADAELSEVFTSVYAIRSAQAAHAQNEPQALTFDDVLKAKTFADLLMAKTYAKDAHAWREARQG